MVLNKIGIFYFLKCKSSCYAIYSQEVRKKAVNSFVHKVLTHGSLSTHLCVFLENTRMTNFPHHCAFVIIFFRRLVIQFNSILTFIGKTLFLLFIWFLSVFVLYADVHIGMVLCIFLCSIIYLYILIRWSVKSKIHYCWKFYVLYLLWFTLVSSLRVVNF